MVAQSANNCKGDVLIFYRHLSIFNDYNRNFPHNYDLITNQNFDVKDEVMTFRQK